MNGATSPSYNGSYQKKLSQNSLNRPTVDSLLDELDQGWVFLFVFWKTNVNECFCKISTWNDHFIVGSLFRYVFCVIV